MGTEFRSEKIPRNRLGTVSVIPRKKVLIPRHSEFRGRASSEARNEMERNGIPRKNMALTVDIDGVLFISSWKLLKKNKRPYNKRTWLKFIQHRACLLVTCRVLFYTERNSEWFSLPRNGSEPNSESLLIFLFYGTEFRVIFSSAEGFGAKFREHASIFDPRNGILRCFLFRGRVRNGIPRISVPRNSRNSLGNNHLFRQFRLPRNYFLVGNSQP